jgi:hypothetical protein
VLANKNLQRLVHHPEPEVFRAVILSSSLHDRQSLVRLWLTEGIPYAFKNCAGTYDEMREWLAKQLGIHAKDVTLVGSGRIGFSMRPIGFGREYCASSDLDLTMVNIGLFESCIADARRFAEHYSKKLVVPRNERQRIFWEDNIRRLESHVRSGFVDTWLFPGSDDYKSILKVNDVMSRLVIRLGNTPGAIGHKKISARIYRNWDSLVNRVAFNLESARKDFLKSQN